MHQRLTNRLANYILDREENLVELAHLVVELHKILEANNALELLDKIHNEGIQDRSKQK